MLAGLIGVIDDTGHQIPSFATVFTHFYSFRSRASCLFHSPNKSNDTITSVSSAAPIRLEVERTFEDV